MGIEEGAIATGLLTVAAVVAGPRALVVAARELISLAPGGGRAIGSAAALLLLLAWATRFHVAPIPFLGAAVATSLGLVALHALATRLPRATEFGWNATSRAHWSWLGAGSMAAALAIGWLVLDRFPHVSDEIAYQFQARTYAAGRLWLPEPPLAECFELPHVMVAEGRSFGIFPPGWPALLAAGVKVGAPWLVNPLLAAAALGLFAALLRCAGLDDVERGIALVTLALAPCFVVQAATMMSHLASLFLLLLLLWAIARLVECGALRFAVVAAAALGGGLLVRSFDFVAAGAPIGAWLLWRTARAGRAETAGASGLFARRGRALAALALLALGGAAGVAATLLYQREVMGDPFAVPAVRYFEASGSGQFGIGFGADMGTRDHGPEWPGFWPSDIPRVSGYRLVEWFRDVGNAPLAALALLLWMFFRWRAETRPLVRVTLASGTVVVLAYALHFYHGIAYGARHWFLALPAFAIAVATVLGSLRREVARPLWLALLVHALLFGTVLRLHEYAGRYRGVSGELRDAVAERSLDHALVFVVERDWGWKFACPLNEWPLEQQPVLFARDRGEANAELAALFPDRERWRVRVTPRGQPLEWTRLP